MSSTIHRTLILALLSATVFPPAAGSQLMIRRGDGSPTGDVLLLRELGVVAGISEVGGTEVRLLLVMSEVEREIALQEDDLVLMVDGQRVRDLATLRQAYEAAEVGQVVRLGIRRGDERFITSFEKVEEGSGPGGAKMMVVGGPGAEYDDVQPVHELGAVLAEKDGEVVVVVELPLGPGGLRERDRILRVNGQEIESLSNYRDLYQALELGEEVRVQVLRDDAEVTIVRPKSEPPSGMITRKRQR
jgi:S1-C subfamily serine protease